MIGNDCVIRNDSSVGRFWTSTIKESFGNECTHSTRLDYGCNVVDQSPNPGSQDLRMAYLYANLAVRPDINDGWRQRVAPLYQKWA